MHPSSRLICLSLLAVASSGCGEPEPTTARDLGADLDDCVVTESRQVAADEWIPEFGLAPRDLEGQRSVSQFEGDVVFYDGVTSTIRVNAELAPEATVLVHSDCPTVLRRSATLSLETDDGRLRETTTANIDLLWPERLRWEVEIPRGGLAGDLDLEALSPRFAESFSTGDGAVYTAWMEQQGAQVVMGALMASHYSYRGDAATRTGLWLAAWGR